MSAQEASVRPHITISQKEEEATAARLTSFLHEFPSGRNYTGYNNRRDFGVPVRAQCQIKGQCISVKLCEVSTPLHSCCRPRLFSHRKSRFSRRRRRKLGPPYYEGRQNNELTARIICFPTRLLTGNNDLRDCFLQWSAMPVCTQCQRGNVFQCGFFKQKVAIKTYRKRSPPFSKLSTLLILFTVTTHRVAVQFSVVQKNHALQPNTSSYLRSVDIMRPPSLYLAQTNVQSLSYLKIHF